MTRIRCSKIKYILRHFLPAVLLSLAPLPSFAQSDTTVLDFHGQNPSWFTVLGGGLIGEPIPTSYGHVLLSEGNMVYGLSDEGSILWRRSFTGRLKPYFAREKGDLIFVVNGTRKLTLLNPSGAVIWETTAGEEITDGRADS